jgi:hypothetical protein
MDVGKPMRPMPFDPIQKPIPHPPQRRDVLREQHQSKRQHPDPEKREDAEDGARDE